MYCCHMGRMWGEQTSFERKGGWEGHFSSGESDYKLLCEVSGLDKRQSSSVEVMTSDPFNLNLNILAQCMIHREIMPARRVLSRCHDRVFHVSAGQSCVVNLAPTFRPSFTQRLVAIINVT